MTETQVTFERPHFTEQAWAYNKKRLTNQIFKLLPLLEEGGDWLKQREAILADLLAYNKLFEDNPNIMTLAAKLLSMESFCEDKFIFRKIVFECITLLNEVVIE